MKRTVLIVMFVALSSFALPALGQGVLNDLLGGKLVNPRVGQWAWYEITDTATGGKFAIRQAVVGEEKVKGKAGFWVEFEIVPEIGYRTVYKMLLTGPARDPKNIHKVLFKTGTEPVATLTVAEGLGVGAAPDFNRKALGEEEVALSEGSVKAQRYSVPSDKGSFEVWVNESIPPTGIVRFKSPEGEMVLRSYGTGGPSSASALDAMSAEAPAPKVSVKTGKDERAETKGVNPPQGRSNKAKGD